MPRNVRQLPEPTTLVMIDETDRLKTAALEQVRESLTKAALVSC